MSDKIKNIQLITDEGKVVTEFNPVENEQFTSLRQEVKEGCLNPWFDDKIRSAIEFRELTDELKDKFKSLTDTALRELGVFCDGINPIEFTHEWDGNKLISTASIKYVDNLTFLNPEPPCTTE